MDETIKEYIKMLNTLFKIGHWQSQIVSEWDDFLDVPKIEIQDRKGNAIKNYILPIIFDLDEADIIIDTANLKEYDEERDVLALKSLKIQPGNNKAVYCTAPPKKLNQLYKTFFGKENKSIEKGELAQVIVNNFPQYKKTTVYSILEESFKLKKRFLELTVNEKKKIDHQVILKKLNLSRNEAIVLFSVCIKSSRFDLISYTYFAELSGYIDFLRTKFIGNIESSDKDTDNRLCYASGKLSKHVDVLDLSTRYSLNKMFVTETLNYASCFNKAIFRKNYQVSKENQKKLGYASKFLLENYKIRIAGIDHVIVPQFINDDELYYDDILEGIKKKSDILFSIAAFKNMVKDIELETDNIYWINFIAFESNGNFFKSIELIKEVSRFHFEKVIQTFHDVHWEFKEYDAFVNWESVMTEFGKKDRLLNFNSVYGLIPVRKDKEKKNIALDLFKAILENRPVGKSKLYNHFSELILCHYFERYKSYTNISKSTKEYFGKNVRDNVFKYLGFFQVLRRLKLIDMKLEKHDSEIIESTGDRYEQVIQIFFKKMAFNQQQKAMFYLGRMLSAVSYIQKDKNKTVIDKMNFNGMDRDKIIRLRLSLFEKAKQYGKTHKVVFSDARFSEHFNFINWNLDSKEAVFFILTGFSFGAQAKDQSKEQKTINSKQD